MNVFTCIVIGGGYAGIHAVKSIRKTLAGKANGRPLRLILIDKNDYHLRKVLLFKPAAADEEIRVPLANLFPEGVELVRGTVTRLDSAERKLAYRNADGDEREIKYDVAVLAAGSIVREPDRDRGGIALSGLHSARKIRETWRANFKRAVRETDPSERRRLLTIAVAGGGISGVETSAELAHFARADAEASGLDPDGVTVYLLNAQKRLFHFGPAKVGAQLERSLASLGVTVLHSTSVEKEREGVLSLSNGEDIKVGLCVWTVGLLPNPMLRELGVPLTPEGCVIVDESYRVQGAPGLYSIGDCARIVDPASGRADGKTCKEASLQAARLGKVIAADVEGQPAPSHKGSMDVFCFGLGPDRGIVWLRQWGIDFLITGKLGFRIRKFTWDIASLLK